MTVLNTNPVYQIFDGNNTGQFTFSYRAFQQVPGPAGSGVYTVDVYVWSGNVADDPVQQIQQTDFVVENIQNETGTIRFLSKTIPSGQKVIILSDIPYTQEESFPSNIPVNPAKTELGLDRLEGQIKQLANEVQRSVRLPFPPTDTTSEVRVNPINIGNGEVLAWNIVNPTSGKYEIVSSGVTIPDLDQAVQTITQALLDAQTAANNAQTAANNAQTAAASAGQSAQSAGAAQTAAEAAKNAVDATKNQIDIIKIDIDSAATQVAADALRAETAANKIPDPANAIQGQGIVADGSGAWLIQDLPFVENLQTAPVGSSLVTTQDASGRKFLIADSNFSAVSKQIATSVPGAESGTDVSQALQTLTANINRLNGGLGLAPWDPTKIVAELLVAHDASLIDKKSAFRVQPVTNRDVVVADLDGIKYYASGSFYDLPSHINGKDLFTNPSSILFSFRPTGAATETVLINKLDLEVKFVPPNLLQITAGSGAPVTFPVVLNEINVVLLGIEGNQISGFIGTKDPSGVTVQPITPIALQVPIAPGAFTFGGSTDARVIELILLQQLVSQQEFRSYLDSLFFSPIVKIPSPDSGQPGQAIVVAPGSVYELRYPVLLNNVPSGYTVDNALDLSSAVPVKGKYNVVITRDDTAQTIGVDVMQETKVVEGGRAVFTAVSATTPIELRIENDNRAELFLQNDLDSSIFIGPQAVLAADRSKGTRVAAGTVISLAKVDAIFAIAESNTTDAAGRLLVVENINVPV